MLSVGIVLTIVGGEVPTSQIWRRDCVQNSASEEFCESCTFMLRDPLPRLDVFSMFARASRGTSSSRCPSRAVEEIELESPVAPAATFFFDPKVIHFDLALFAVGCFTSDGLTGLGLVDSVGERARGVVSLGARLPLRGM